MDVNDLLLKGNWVYWMEKTIKHEKREADIVSDAQLKPRQVQAVESRRKILETASRLFDEKGYDNVGIADICEAAGFSTGAFYHYFKSKEEILAERYLPVAQVAEALFVEIDKQARQGSSSSVDRLARFVRAFLGYTNAVGPETTNMIQSIVIRPGYASSERIAAMLMPHHFVEKIIEEGQRAGEIRDDLSAADIASGLYNCIVGIIYTWCLPNVSVDLMEEAEKTIALVTEGLRKR